MNKTVIVASLLFFRKCSILQIVLNIICLKELTETISKFLEIEHLLIDQNRVLIKPKHYQNTFNKAVVDFFEKQIILLTNHLAVWIF